MSVKYVKAPRGFPAELIICDQRWAVKYSPNLLEAKEAYGMTSSHQRLIVIESTQSHDLMVSTLLHEVLHAMNASAPHHGLTSDTEERHVAAIEPVLLSFLRSNKPFWK